MPERPGQSRGEVADCLCLAVAVAIAQALDPTGHALGEEDIAIRALSRFYVDYESR